MNERLKYYRNKKHLSQAYVASILNISRKTVISIEKGISKVSIEQLTNLAELYGVPVDVLINGENTALDLGNMKEEFNNLSQEDKIEIMNFIKFKINSSHK